MFSVFVEVSQFPSVNCEQFSRYLAMFFTAWKRMPKFQKKKEKCVLSLDLLIDDLSGFCDYFNISEIRWPNRSKKGKLGMERLVAGADGCCDGIAFLFLPFFLGSVDALIFKHVGTVLHGASPLYPVLSGELPLVGVYVAD